MAGTGLVSASSGIQMRAASRVPSDIGIHTFSRTLVVWGKDSTIFKIVSSLQCIRIHTQRVQ